MTEIFLTKYLNIVNFNDRLLKFNLLLEHVHIVHKGLIYEGITFHKSKTYS